MQLKLLAGAILMLAFVANPLSASGEANNDTTLNERLLVVTLSVNGRQVSEGELVYRLGPGTWALPAASLARLGVKIGWEQVVFHGVSHLVLREEPGVEIDYDDATIHLALVLGPALFSATQLSADGPKSDLVAKTVEVPAIYFEYDVGLLANATNTSGDGLVGVGASGGWGVGISQWAFSSATDRLVHRETSLTFDSVEDLSTIVLGDGIAPSFGGMLAVPFTGISWYTNFEIDPTFISFPLPAVTGTGTAPGSVEVFVNGRSAYNSKIGEGHFEIEGIRAPAGVSHVEVVTRDLFGTETRTVEPVYVEPLLLKRGLSAVAVSTGWERADIGDDDFVYGRPIARAALRRGMTEEITIGTELETSDRIADVNLAIDAVVAGVASFSMSGGASWASESARATQSGSASSITTHEDTGDVFGRAFAVSAIRRTKYLSIAGSVRYASDGYRQLGTTGVPAVERSYNLSSGGRMFDGTLTASAAWYSVREDQDYGVGTLNYTHDLPGWGKWTVGGSYIGGSREGVEASFGIVIPLGDGHTGSSSIMRNYNRAYSTTASVSKSLPTDHGSGYHTSVEYDETLNMIASIDYRHPTIEGRLGFVDRGGHRAVRARTRGGLVLTEGSLFASRQIEKGMVLVETPGAERVPISVNNQDTGDTGTNGRTLVPVSPFVPFRVTVDETLLPIDKQLARVSAEGSVGRRRVAVIQFHSMTSHTLTATVRFPDGTIPAAGTPLVVEGEPASLPVGYDGVVYLVSDDPVGVYSLQSPRGRCTFVVDFETLKSAEADDDAPPILHCL